MEKSLNIEVELEEIIEICEDSDNKIRDDDFINIELISSCESLEINQLFTYTIIIKNKSNHELFDIKITQKIQECLKVTDIVMEGINISNAEKHNKFLTFNIEKINGRETKSIDITVKVIDNYHEKLLTSKAKLEGKFCCNGSEENTIIAESMICSINAFMPKLSLKEKICTREALVGEIVTFKILVQNEGNLDLGNVIISNILRPELKFINNTVRIDGAETLNQNIVSGINIGLLKEGYTKEIAFDVEILSKSDTGIVTNRCAGLYEYNIKGENKLRRGNAIGNETRLIIQEASLKINKIADKETISLGDEITYTIYIENNGTLEIKNMLINEEISEALILEEGQFAIDGKTINNISILKNIFIGDLRVSERKTITYKVKYDKASKSREVKNVTKVNFDYKQTSGLIFKGNEIKKELELRSTISTFKYISRSEEISKEENSPCIEEIYNVSAEVDILEYHVVETMKGKSCEGQNLTGYEIALQGLIREIIEYSSDEGSELAYIINVNIPFSTFIILPVNFKVGSRISISYEIDDISFKKRNNISIYTNICLLLIANIQPY